MSLRILALDHVVLRVADLERAVGFYTEVLGCSVERRVADLGLVQLRAGAGLVDLVETAGPIGRQGGAPPGAQGRNMDHFCLRLADFDAEAIHRHLHRFGVSAGPVEQRYGAEGVGPSIYLDDPDGNRVELKGPPASAAGP